MIIDSQEHSTVYENKWSSPNQIKSNEHAFYFFMYSVFEDSRHLIFPPYRYQFVSSILV